MSEQRKHLAATIAVIAVMFLVVGLILSGCGQQAKPLGVSNLDMLHLSDTNDPSGTATPLLMIDDTGSGNAIELRRNATPVYYVNASGAVVAAGETKTGNLDMANYEIVNIGAAGTDFESNGGLALAAGETIATGGITITAGTATIAGLTSLNGGLTMDSGKVAIADTSGNVILEGTLGVTGATTLNGANTVAGLTTLNGGLTMDAGKVVVADTSGNTILEGTLGVTGATTLNGAATIAGLASLNGGLTMDSGKVAIADTSGNTILEGTLGVTGATTLNGAATVAGLSSLNGGLTMDSGKVAIADTSGNTILEGTLGVTGATTLNGGANMANSVISNIGAAGTDFESNGGLVLAQGLSVSAGGITATVGTATLGTEATTKQRYTVATTLYLTETVGAGAVIAYTNSFQPIGSYAASGVGSITGGAVGDILILYNRAAQNIIITDTAAISLANTYTMTADDTLTLLHTGDAWVETARSVN